MAHSVFVVGKKRPKKIIMPGDLGSKEKIKQYKMPSGVELSSIEMLPLDHPVRKEIQLKMINEIKKEAAEQIAQKGIYTPVTKISEFYNMPFKEAQYKVYHMVHGVSYVKLSSVFNSSQTQLKKLMTYYGIIKNPDGTAMIDNSVTSPVETIKPKKGAGRPPKQFYEMDTQASTNLSLNKCNSQNIHDNEIVFRQELRGRYSADLLLQLIESLENTIISQPDGKFEIDISITRKKEDIIHS